MSEYEYKYEYKKYATNLDGLKSTLDKYGVAIIPSVLDEKNATICFLVFGTILNILVKIGKNQFSGIRGNLERNLPSLSKS